MTYQDQLKAPEWKAKRLTILERDNYRCTCCNCERTKFLGLLRNFGIKTLDELKLDGYAVFGVHENKGVLMAKNNFLITATYIGDQSNEIILENLNFAMQWKEAGPKFPNSKGFGEIICFSEIISKEQKFPDLNIHHKYYIIGKNAWEYQDDALLTLCSKCHQLEHENNKILVYAQSGDIMYIAENCNKCGGSGYLPEFDYFQSGICFSCNGHGVELK
jgi:hypothetical protein